MNFGLFDMIAAFSLVCLLVDFLDLSFLLCVQFKEKKILSMRWIGMINFNDMLDDKTIESINNIAVLSGESISKISEALERLSNSLCESMKSLEEIFKDIEEIVEPPDDISTIKKQIKYCKNPMEIKALNKRLNDAYKKKNKNKKR